MPQPLKQSYTDALQDDGSVQVLVYASIMSMISGRSGQERLQTATLTHLIDSSSPRIQQIAAGEARPAGD